MINEHHHCGHDYYAMSCEVAVESCTSRMLHDSIEHEDAIKAAVAARADASFDV